MNRISDIRRSLCLSQNDFAAKLGVGQSMVSQYETGACDPSIKVSRRLIEYALSCGVPLTMEQIYSVSQEPVPLTNVATGETQQS